MNAKYVVINCPEIGTEAIVIFPSFFSHDSFKSKLDYSQTIISAGFVTLENGEFFCHGRSESLNLDSRPREDGLLANILIGRIA